MSKRGAGSATGENPRREGQDTRPVPTTHLSRTTLMVLKPEALAIWITAWPTPLLAAFWMTESPARKYIQVFIAGATSKSTRISFTGRPGLKGPVQIQSQAHGQPPVHQHSQVLLCRAAFQQIRPKLRWCRVVPPAAGPHTGPGWISSGPLCPAPRPTPAQRPGPPAAPPGQSRGTAGAVPGARRSKSASMRKAVQALTLSVAAHSTGTSLGTGSSTASGNTPRVRHVPGPGGVEHGQGKEKHIMRPQLTS